MTTATASHRAHGSYAKYTVEHCRCAPCRKANADYERRRLRAITRPDEIWLPYISAARARAHIDELRAQGLGLRTIAKASGVPRSILTAIAMGNPTRGNGPSRRIRPSTEARILAVPTGYLPDGQQLVDATDTWALLDELIARGYTRAWLAQRITRSSTARSLRLSRVAVYASTARRVEALHRLLGDRPGPGRRARCKTK